MAKSDATALGALILFVVLFICFTSLGVYFFKIVEDTESANGRKGLRELVADKEADLAKTEGEHAVNKQALFDNMQKLREAQQKYDLQETDLNRARKDGDIFLARTDMGDADAGSAGRVRDKVVEGKKAIKTWISGMKEARDTEYTEQLKELRGKVDEITKELVKEEDRRKRVSDEHRQKRDFLDSEIDNHEDMLAKMTARDIEHARADSDGLVLKIDEPTKLAVINVGSAAGVKKGFIFEAFQIKEGNRRIHKGLLEVKTVEPETSTCTILLREIHLPRCPTTGYVAQRPEERYSPYDSGGQSGLKVVKLLAKPKEVMSGMNPDDPMAAGDLIYNPFFKPGGGLRFCVKGDLKIEYSRDEVVAAITEHGGIVEDDLSAKTDYLVGQRWAQDAVKKARELGVPVLFEFDLFDFLRHMGGGERSNG